MKRVVVLLVTLAAAAALAVAGCGPRRAPTDPPAIAGRITSVSANETGDAGSIMVEGSGSLGDKASFKVPGTVAVLRQVKDGSIAAATFGDLQTGMRVSVWSEGPVAESYPVQATASVVLIVD